MYIGNGDIYYVLYYNNALLREAWEGTHKDALCKQVLRWF